MSEMTEETARELIAALRENTAATTRAAVANEGVMQVLTQGEAEDREEEPASAPTYMDGSPR